MCGLSKNSSFLHLQTNIISRNRWQSFAVELHSIEQTSPSDFLNVIRETLLNLHQLVPKLLSQKRRSVVGNKCFSVLRWLKWQIKVSFSSKQLLRKDLHRLWVSHKNQYLSESPSSWITSSEAIATALAKGFPPNVLSRSQNKPTISCV